MIDALMSRNYRSHVSISESINLTIFLLTRMKSAISISLFEETWDIRYSLTVVSHRIERRSMQEMLDNAEQAHLDTKLAR